MEEITNKLTLTYVGNIDGKAYINMKYNNGFTDNTTLVVKDSCSYCDIDFDKVPDVTNYNNPTIQTLIIKDADASEIVDYTVEIFEAGSFVEAQTVSTDPTDVPALIKKDVSVQAIGDRIIEILFAEPVKNLESNFSFAKDHSNRNNPFALTDQGNIILLDVATGKEFFTNSTGTFEMADDGTEASSLTSFISGNDIKSVFIDLVALDAVTTPKAITLPLTPEKDSTIALVTNGRATTPTAKHAYVKYLSEYSSEPNGDSSVLLNYYFRYYGSDDEGTLYEPTDKPIDWLGYFAGKDTTTTVSSDKRKIEVQFDYYSLPTGDTHQLIINYAKTFPNYPGNLRIQDANQNPFPIVSEKVVIDKLATKAVVTNVVALSKDEILVTYSKAVLCQHEVGKVITINGATPEEITRYNNTYNTLLCKLDTLDALPVGDATPVEIGSIIDACGYTTAIYNTEIPVVAVKPKVISLEQGETANEGLETILDIVFTDEMTIIDSLDATPYFEIFKVVDGIKELINPTITVKNQTPQETLKVSVTDPILYPGYTYEINIAGMTNTYLTEMEPYTRLLHIKDMSAPTIKDIFLTNHNSFDADTEGYKIAVIYNEPMTFDGPHSLTNVENYAVNLGHDINDAICDKATKNIKLSLNNDNCISIVPLKENTIARISLEKIFFKTDGDNTPIEFIPEDVIVRAGHCELKEVKYLTNLSNNILNFVCPTIEKLSTKIDLESQATKFTVVDNETLVIDYMGDNNELLNVDPSSFIINDKAPSTLKTLGIDSVINSPTQITVIFPTDTFLASEKTLTIEVNGEDLFGNLMAATTAPIALTYDAAPKLNKAYLYAVHSDSAIFALNFNEKVKIRTGVSAKLAARDYSISVNGNALRPATIIGDLVLPDAFDSLYVESTDSEHKTLFLQYDNLSDITFSPDDTFAISVTVQQEAFNTVDATAPLNPPVEIFTNVDANTPIPNFGTLSATHEIDDTAETITLKVKLDSDIFALDDLGLDTSTTKITLAPSPAPVVGDKLVNYTNSATLFFKSFIANFKVGLTNISSLGLAGDYSYSDGVLIVAIDTSGATDITPSNIESIEFELVDLSARVDGIPVYNGVITSTLYTPPTPTIP